ncbi:glutamate racemase [Clostridium lacusfryxellense]|uniref:glutamate racemase n=1 Tax=Clostridium lacusfryxellense TaxID=205328 RepID=UPI001C0B69CC|nr:glutamate racemase [Clostridium lacusfryxellense]MBU3110601.1 glutamate racemase [Clostridium lacusfryxellense]
MNNKEKSIGFFDSGVGGISVLKESLSILPNEDFIYFGDSINAPYGTKNVNEVKKLAFNAVDFLLNKGVKVIVIACNTATSAAIDDLRLRYTDIPIIGIEPALKPAVEVSRGRSVVIMATPMTLAEKKFSNLMEVYKEEVDIIPLPCEGLVELIEEGIIEGEQVEKYLKGKLTKIMQRDVASIVLGCTHYPFIKKELVKIVGEKIIIIDGSIGTVNQLKRKLVSKNILNDKKTKSRVSIYNSSQDNKIIDLSYKLLRL